MTSRTDVYAAIDSERAYQDNLWPDGEGAGSNKMSIGEFLLLAEEYIAKARAAWVVEKRPEINALNIMRKVAGIAVNCMEQHGAPRREGY